MNHFEKTVNHIATFAMMPQWLDEMRRWTKELESQEHGLFQGLGLAVKQRIDEIKGTNVKS